MKKKEILDCTLRDGSYVLNFNFSLLDTFLITKVLFESGINYVEIGHGLGLGASKNKKIKKSLHNDNDYISVSNLAKVSKLNKIGCFCFSRNVTNKDFDNAKKNGLNFIRFAFEIKNLTKLKKDIIYCKKIGLEVHLNLIKTYKYSLLEIKNILKKIDKLDINYLYIVDSSGGMTNLEIEKYIKFIKNKINKSIGIGFHGHNNLGLANSNCIIALNNGASIVDTSMLGMGRGAGNAITESVVAYLMREKYLRKIDITKILNFIKNYLVKIFPQKYLVENVLMGKSYFHDSEIEKLKKLSKKNKVNYLNALNKISFRKGINQKQLNIKYLNDKKSIKNILDKNNFFENERLLSNVYEDISSFKKDLIAQSLKINSPNILTVCRGKRLEFKIYKEMELVIGHIVSPSTKKDDEILKFFKSFNIFFDTDIKRKNYFNYSEIEVNLKACKDVLNIKKYKFIKFHGSFNKDFLNSFDIYPLNKKEKKGIYIVNKQIRKITKNSDLLLLNNVNINISKNLNVNIIKPNYGLVLASEVKRLLELNKTNFKYKKRIKINKNLFVIEKGNIGKENDIVVDSILSPNFLIGQSDGRGGIKRKFKIDRLSKIEILNWIYQSSIK